MNAETALPFLCELLAKSFAILLFAALLVRLWRGATAAQRHLVWFAAVISILLLPMTRLIAPHWAVPLEREAKISLPMPDLPMAPMVKLVTPTGSAVTAPLPRAWKPPHWRKVIPGVWLGGAVFLLGYRLLGSWRLRRLERSSFPSDDARIHEITGAVLRELNIGHHVQIRVSKECRVPMTWGARPPVLMLPAEALRWNDALLRTALRHEAGHISRHDYLIRWITQLACALYWPNPLAWLVARALRAAQEQATDDLVLRAGTPPDEYAAQLLEAARTVAARGSFAHHAVAMASPSTLAGRVVAIVDDQRDRRPLSRRAVVLGSIIVACSLAVCTAAQLQGNDQAPAATPETAGKAAPGQNEPPVTAKGEAGAAVNGITAGAIMGLGPIRAEDKPDESSAKHFTLHIPIKARPGKKVNVQDLVIHVLFYDLIDGKTVLQTTANVHSYWMAPPADWTKGDTEELAVDYQLPHPESASAQREDRKYFGYLVRLYYQRQLQAATAEPERLIHQYPAPQTLPLENPSKTTSPKSEGQGGASDLGDLYFTAYTAIHKAEELETQRHFKEALSGMKAGLQALEELTRLNPHWEPQIVAYRRERAQTAVARIAPLADAQDGPVEITSNWTRMENGIAVAGGNASLKFGKTTLTAASIRYNPEYHSAQCEGKVEVDDGTSITHGEKIGVAFDEGGKLTIVGPYTVTVKPAPADSPPLSPASK